MIEAKLSSSSDRLPSQADHSTTGLQNHRIAGGVVPFQSAALGYVA